jgi:hypothetical protein
MYARAIDEAETRLLELRHEEQYQLGLSALALAASLAMTAIYAPVVLPLFVAGLAVGMLGMRTFWQRWDIVDRLADERDAYVIPEVLSYAARDVCMERRSNSAALVRSWLCTAAVASNSPILAQAEELEALACELEDRDLVLDPHLPSLAGDFSPTVRSARSSMTRLGAKTLSHGSFGSGTDSRPGRRRELAIEGLSTHLDRAQHLRLHHERRGLHEGHAESGDERRQAKAVATDQPRRALARFDDERPDPVAVLGAPREDVLRLDALARI